MKTAQYGTAIVVMHVIAHGLHGLVRNPSFPFSASGFVCGCCGGSHCSRFTLDAVLPHR